MDQRSLLSLASALPNARQLGSPQNPKKTSPLLQLPLDVHFLICDSLPTEDHYSYALSCKGLYTYCFPDPALLGWIDKDDFLVRLEKDNPNLCYCFRYRHLHKINKKRGHVKKDCYKDCNFLPTLNQARAVMNSHLLGPDHGIDLKKAIHEASV